MLNAQDINGDTPLHRAVDIGDIDVFNCLLMNPRVRLDVANKEAMTPVDLSITKIPSHFHYALVSCCSPISISQLSLPSLVSLINSNNNIVYIIHIYD